MKATEDVLDLFEKIRLLPLDIRVEVILADLVADGYQFEDFTIHPVGVFARNYRRDIGELTLEPGKRWAASKLTIEVHREGLYDALPEEVFHHPGEFKPRQTSREVVEGIQVQRRKEKAARRFFLPFEQEFYRHRVLLELEERRYFINLSAYWYNEVLAKFWELTDKLEPRKVANLVYLLPLAHRVIGDTHLTQLCFECILDNPVQIRTIAPLQHPIVSAEQTAADTGIVLGKAELGRDTVLGGVYQETLPALEVSIQSLNPTLLELYFTDSQQSRALILLCNYFLPFETDVVIRYEVAEEFQSFILSDENAPAMLGISTLQL